MKLKDGFYASSHGIGGLMLDMPTKNPKTRKKPKFKVGDMVRCEAEGVHLSVSWICRTCL